MISTFNGCYHSEIKVIPKNWNTSKASIKKPWRIYYRFHDPAWKHVKKYKYGLPVKIQGMNIYKTLEERQKLTRELIADEEQQLQVLGLNIITQLYMAPKAEIPKSAIWEVTPDTPLILALERTLVYCYSEEAINLMKSDNYEFRRLDNLDVVYKEGELMMDETDAPLSMIAAISRYIVLRELTAEIEPETVIDIKSTLKYFAQSATILQLNQVPIKEIKSKDIKAILDNCKNLTVEKIVNKRVEVEGKLVVQKHIVDGKLVPIKIVAKEEKKWNDNQYNHYRKYLRVLFSKIKKLEVLEYNPIDNLDIKNSTPEDPDAASRKVLTPEERRTIHIKLITQFPEFLRLIHIFYHSGSRRKEMMKVQGKHVDLVGQRFKVLVKKGKSRWKWKTIKDAALTYWQEAMAGCGQEDYVFSKGLLPGPLPIRPEQVTRRWHEHVKKKLGITSRFYDLKHLHTTEIINELEQIKKELQAAVAVAAEHNSHSEAMVVNIYDTEHEKRKHRSLKGLKTSFAG